MKYLIRNQFSVALVAQQAEQIRKNSNLIVGEHHGWRNLDIWDGTRWNDELSKNQVHTYV